MIAVYLYAEESPNIALFYKEHVVGNSHQVNRLRGASRDAFDRKVEDSASNSYIEIYR
jgi:hypothetical protein